MISNRRNRMLLTLVSPGCSVLVLWNFEKNILTNVKHERSKIKYSLMHNRSNGFATNSYFLVPISLQPMDVGDLRYFKLWILSEINILSLKYQWFPPSGCQDIVFENLSSWQRLYFLLGIIILNCSDFCTSKDPE